MLTNTSRTPTSPDGPGTPSAPARRPPRFPALARAALACVLATRTSGSRVDGGETNISLATASTYTLVGDDEGKTIKVKVSFTDDASNPETRTSAATLRRNSSHRGDWLGSVRCPSGSSWVLWPASAPRVAAGRSGAGCWKGPRGGPAHGVPTAPPSPMRAPDAFDSTSAKVSPSSSWLSSRIGTRTVFSRWPTVKVSVPLIAV